MTYQDDDAAAPSALGAFWGALLGYGGVSALVLSLWVAAEDSRSGAMALWGLLSCAVVAAGVLLASIGLGMVFDQGWRRFGLALLAGGVLGFGCALGVALLTLLSTSADT